MLSVLPTTKNRSHFESATHADHQLPRQGESDARPFDLSGLLTESVEGTEHPIQVFGADADAGVRHGDGQFRLVVRQAADVDSAVPLVVLDRVGQQVQQHLAQPPPIGEDVSIRRSIAAIQVDRDLVHRRHRLQESDRLEHQIVNSDRLDRQLELIGRDPGKVQEVVDHLQQVLPTKENVPDRIQLRSRAGLQLQELGEAEHRVQRRAQLMAHSGEEFVLGSIGQLGFVPRRSQCLLGYLAGGDVLHAGSEQAGRPWFGHHRIARDTQPANVPRRLNDPQLGLRRVADSISPR